MTTRKAQHSPLQEINGSDTLAGGPVSGPVGAGFVGKGARAGVAHGRRARFATRTAKRGEILAASNYLGGHPEGTTIAIGSADCAALNYLLIQRLRIGPLRVKGAPLPEPRPGIVRRICDCVFGPFSGLLDWLAPKLEEIEPAPPRFNRPSIFRS